MTANRAEVQAQLDRILASSVFSASARSAQFLRFCVEQSLQGNHDQIKESTVAVEVFGRTPGYDSKIDPIVRVHAKRLREKLDNYYAAQGIDDPIRIVIPKGTYVPQAIRTLPKTKLDFSDWARERAEPVHAPPTQARPRSWAWLQAVVVISLVAVIGVVFLITHHQPPSSTLHVSSRVLPFNAYPGIERNPSWSPDGKLLAFSWNGNSDASSQIYLQKVNQSQPYRLTQSSQPEYTPIWSPDGTEIAFTRYIDFGHYEVLRTSRDGGSERSVGNFSYYFPVRLNTPALDWSPDGKSLLVAEQSSSSSPVRLLLLTLATGERRFLTSPGSGTSGDLEGKFSPDGTLVAIHRGGFGDLYVVSVAGEVASPARKLTFNNPGIRGIAWTRDGKHILFGTHRNSSSWDIWQIDIDGNHLEPLLSEGLDVTSPAISPDGTQLAAEHDQHITNLTEVPLGQIGQSHLFIPSTRQDYSPVFSPDGKNIVFISTRSGLTDLWLAASDSSSVRKLTSIDGTGFPMNPSWSPDGKKIIFALRKDGQTNLAVVNVSEGATQQLTFSSSRYINPVYSADGKNIYFVSNADGIGRIWRMPSYKEGHAEDTFWDTPGVFQMSQDRSSIFFADSQPGLNILKRDIETGSTRSVFRSEKQLSSFQDICVHGDQLYLMLSSVKQPSHSDLISVDIGTGLVTPLKSFDRSSGGMESGCTVSPDGKTLLITTMQQESSDIYITTLSY